MLSTGKVRTMAENKEPTVMNIYDGAGNEKKVVATEDSQGQTVQATGDTAEEAMANKDKQDHLGPAFGGH